MPNLVQVEFYKDGRRYTYDAGDLVLNVGDRAKIPGGRVVTVVELGSDYDGPTKSLVCKDDLALCPGCKKAFVRRSPTMEFCEECQVEQKS